ncbi:hypothetical protein BpHYR1_050684 [Brachionus plicatilis]|uniref:Uncharacterized protein n=1 Tax=Brachionus plicatilis TaxID=10195 RepID=A0A3M7RBX8_BRAPC|nr:hypothetical protein BpHYR1_050684 [Brachionus plicatilis]
MLNFSQQGENFFLQCIAAASDGVGRGRQFQVDVMVGQELSDGHFVEAKANFGLLAKQTKTGHGCFDGVHVYAPQIHKKNYFELELGVLGHGYVAAHVRVIFVVEQKCVAQYQNFSKPLEHVCVVDNLVLDQLLRYGKKNLGADAPKCVYGRLGIPFFDVFFLVEHEQGLHGRVGHIGHARVVHQRHQAVEQLENAHLGLVVELVGIVQHQIGIDNDQSDDPEEKLFVVGSVLERFVFDAQFVAELFCERFGGRSQRSRAAHQSLVDFVQCVREHVSELAGPTKHNVDGGPPDQASLGDYPVQ